MMTPDKDYGQIVDDHIFLYKPAFMGNAVDVMGPKQVCEKWDIDHVDKVRDILGLMGDAVDNIPGIPGIGEKNSRQIAERIRFIGRLIANVDKLKGKQRENVENFAQQGILSKELATIKIDVPVDFHEEELRYDGIDEEKLRAIFTELEFRTLAARIFKEPSAKKSQSGCTCSDGFIWSCHASPAVVTASSQESTEEELPEVGPPPVLDTIWSNVHNYHKVKGKKEVTELVEYLLLQKEICFDTETTALDAMQAELVGLSFSYLPGEAYYIPVSENQTETQEILEILRPVFENEAITKIGQNVKYDMLVLKNYGIEIKGTLYDTMLAHYLIEPEGKHSMDWLAQQYLNYMPVSITELIGKKR